MGNDDPRRARCQRGSALALGGLLGVACHASPSSSEPDVPEAALIGPAMSPPAPEPEPELTDEQRFALATQLFALAEAAEQAGSWSEALEHYEACYYLVPGKHGFAHRVAIAAYEAGELTKACQYGQHFMLYADPIEHAAKLEEVERIVAALDERYCVKPEVETVHEIESYECQLTDPPEKLRRTKRRERRR